MNKFGFRLENLREQAGYTKKNMSIKLGFTANVYGSYEREDRRPTLETLIKLADIFNVSLDYLIRGQEFSKSNNAKNNCFSKELKKYLNENNIKNLPLLENKNWKILSTEDIHEINDHFEWMIEKAKKRKNFS